ncbi:MAG: hypothetical protein Q9227_003660 [Pyrenula ochraceoflavens]
MFDECPDPSYTQTEPFSCAAPTSFYGCCYHNPCQTDGCTAGSKAIPTEFATGDASTSPVAVITSTVSVTNAFPTPASTTNGAQSSFTPDRTGSITSPALNTITRTTTRPTSSSVVPTQSPTALSWGQVRAPQITRTSTISVVHASDFPTKANSTAANTNQRHQGAVIGSAIGATAVAAVASALVYVCCRKKFKARFKVKREGNEIESDEYHEGRVALSQSGRQTDGFVKPHPDSPVVEYGDTKRIPSSHGLDPRNSTSHHSFSDTQAHSEMDSSLPRNRRPAAPSPNARTSQYTTMSELPNETTKTRLPELPPEPSRELINPRVKQPPQMRFASASVPRFPSGFSSLSTSSNNPSVTLSPVTPSPSPPITTNNNKNIDNSQIAPVARSTDSTQSLNQAKVGSRSFDTTTREGAVLRSNLNPPGNGSRRQTEGHAMSFMDFENGGTDQVGAETADSVKGNAGEGRGKEGQFRFGEEGRHGFNFQAGLS